MPYRFVPIGSTTSFQDALPVINNNFAQLDGEAVTKTFNGANGQPSFILGQLPGSLGEGLVMKDKDGNVSIAAYIDADDKPILKVAGVGKDAITGSDEDMIFNSAQDIFKIVKTDTVTLHRAVNNMTGTLSVAHGLGYEPIAIAYALLSGTYLPLPWLSTTPLGIGSMGIDKDIGFSVDATNLNLFTDVDDGGIWFGTAESFSVKYYLLQETAN
jgi:hypothetical protein